MNRIYKWFKIATVGSFLFPFFIITMISRVFIYSQFSKMLISEFELSCSQRRLATAFFFITSCSDVTGVLISFEVLNIYFLNSFRQITFMAVVSGSIVKIGSIDNTDGSSSWFPLANPKCALRPLFYKARPCG